MRWDGVVISSGKCGIVPVVPVVRSRWLNGTGHDIVGTAAGGCCEHGGQR